MIIPYHQDHIHAARLIQHRIQYSTSRLGSAHFRKGILGSTHETCLLQTPATRGLARLNSAPLFLKTHLQKFWKPTSFLGKGTRPRNFSVIFRATILAPPCPPEYCLKSEDVTATRFDAASALALPHKAQAAFSAASRTANLSTRNGSPPRTTTSPSTITVSTTRPCPVCTNVPNTLVKGLKYRRVKSNKTRSARLPTRREPI
jgi:hypothetical protein